MAVCENSSCGAVFPAPNIFGGPGSTNIQMTGSRYGPCPKCGGYGRIPDGTYRYSNNIVQFLRGPKESVDVLKKIESLLRTPRIQKLSRSEVLDEVRNVSPGVAEGIEKMSSVPVIQNWIAVAIAFVTFLILIQTTYFKKSDKEVEKLFIEHLMEENKKFNSPGISGKDPAQKSPVKPSRNTPCACGSGKKTKRCCGAAVKVQ